MCHQWLTGIVTQLYVVRINIRDIYVDSLYV